jgi:hypothetical protein
MSKYTLKENACELAVCSNVVVSTRVGFIDSDKTNIPAIDIHLLPK